VIPKCENKRANKKWFCEHHKNTKNDVLKKSTIGILGAAALTVTALFTSNNSDDR